MTDMHLLRVLISSIVVSVTLPGTAVGQSESDALPDRVSLSVGGFLVDHVNTELRVETFFIMTTSPFVMVKDAA